MKIAINNCFGGFSVNNKVAQLLREEGVKVTFHGEYYSDGSGPKDDINMSEDGIHHFDNEDFGITSDNYCAWRADPRLIKAIEKIGKKESNTSISKINIVNIPEDIDWSIDNYDGMETIHEAHRSWS